MFLMECQSTVDYCSPINRNPTGIQAKEPAISENASVEMPSMDIKEGRAKGRLTYLWFNAYYEREMLMKRG